MRSTSLGERIVALGAAIMLFACLACVPAWADDASGSNSGQSSDPSSGQSSGQSSNPGSGGASSGGSANPGTEGGSSGGSANPGSGENNPSGESTDPGTGGEPSGGSDPSGPVTTDVTFSVSSSVATVSPAGQAQASVTGNPDDPNFTVTVTLMLVDGLYDQIVYPSAADGAVTNVTATSGGGSFTLSLVNAEGATAFANGQPITMRFHRSDVDAWIERTVTLDTQAATITIAGDAVTVDIVKALIASLPHDPYDISGDANGAIMKAQNSYAMLSASDQAILDNDLVVKDGREISRSYGRYLEQAMWSISALAAIDNSTTLPDGTYTGKVVSDSNMGKSTSARAKKFSVVSITVKDGRAMALLEHDSDTSETLRVGGIEYENINPSGKSRYLVPIDLNSTFHFSVKGKGATAETDAITYEMTATIDEANAVPDKPGEGEGQDGSGKEDDSDSGKPGDSDDDPDAQSGTMTDEQAAKQVSDAIALLPKARAVTAADKAVIEAVRASYNKLTKEQKVLVENVSRLEAAESALALIVVDEGGDTPGKSDTPSDDRGQTPPPATADDSGSGSSGDSANSQQEDTTANAQQSSTPRQSTNLAFNAPTTTSTTASTTNLPDVSTTGQSVNPAAPQAQTASTLAAADDLNMASAIAQPSWFSQHVQLISLLSLLVLVVGGATVFTVGFVKSSRLKY